MAKGKRGRQRNKRKGRMGRKDREEKREMELSRQGVTTVPWDEEGRSNRQVRRIDPWLG